MIERVAKAVFVPARTKDEVHANREALRIAPRKCPVALAEMLRAKKVALLRMLPEEGTLAEQACDLDFTMDYLTARGMLQGLLVGGF